MRKMRKIPLIQLKKFLENEYEKLNYINEDSVLNYYINKKDLPKNKLKLVILFIHLDLI